MAVLTWGAPTLKIALSNGAPIGDWTILPTPKESTTILETAQGDKTEAKNEAGETVDTRYAKSSYSLKFSLFGKKGESKPIQDEDGIILQNYAIRLIPEDPTCKGFQIDFASVTVEESWSAEDGTLYTYTFDGLKPTSGKILKEYIENQGMVATPSALYFGNSADQTGKTITVTTSESSISASSNQEWCTVTTAGKVATVKVTANTTGAVRTATVTLTAGDVQGHYVITQIPA